MADDRSKVEVVVTLERDACPDIGQLVERLSDQGLERAMGLGSIGVVTGVITSDRMAALRTVPGVSAVERAGGVQLPSPDADVQ